MAYMRLRVYAQLLCAATENKEIQKNQPSALTYFLCRSCGGQPYAHESTRGGGAWQLRPRRNSAILREHTSGHCDPDCRPCHRVIGVAPAGPPSPSSHDVIRCPSPPRGDPHIPSHRTRTSGVHCTTWSCHVMPWRRTIAKVSVRDVVRNQSQATSATSAGLCHLRTETRPPGRRP